MAFVEYPPVMPVPRRLVASVLLAVVALVVAACGGGATPTEAPADPTASTASASPAPTGSDLPIATVPPLETPPPSDPASAEPTAGPSTPPASGAPASSGPGIADACTGTDANRDFFESVAMAVGWPVYCAILPGGWFVDAGEYRLAAGGRMEITYRGPGGASIALSEGAFCTAEPGCLPDGTGLGDARFGDLTGTLVSADDGSWALGVDVGSPISWLAVGSGVDEAAFRSFAEDLTLVSD